MKEEKKLYRIIVKGRVQGVGFRHSCMKEARFRGICGFVENKPDGSVFIEAEAEPDKLNQLIDWCWKRPGFGTIDEVKVECGEPENHNSFLIRY